MSGIAGMVRLDGGHCDRPLLERMTAFQAFRGPHGHRVWTDGGVGLGHALFKLSDGEQPTPQPATLDGKVWITAHARIDARADLRAALRGRGRQVEPDADDALLLLHAYEAWGEACVEHIIGDFTFAIWDGRARILFCAVDPLGIRPFYYADAGGTFIFSNTLDCLRLYPGAAAKLDETAVGDFLLFGEYQDRDRTIHADIKRIAPAHCLRLSSDGSRVRRYWDFQEPRELDRSRPDDIIEQFRSLLRTATSDRMRTGEVGVSMSGGLDSPLVASAATRAPSGALGAARVRAYTQDFSGLVRHEEAEYATEAAAKFGIELQIRSSSDFTAFDWIDRCSWRPAEPANEPAWSVFQVNLQEIAGRSRIVLTGYDGDVLLLASLPHYWRTLARNGRWLRLARDAWSYVGRAHGPPPIGFRTALQRRLWRRPPLPGWLAPDFVRRAGLRERWIHHFRDGPARPALHPRHRNIERGLCHGFFDSFDPGWTGCAIEAAHPLADLRVVDFALRLPLVPWCLNKTIFRESAKGILPERLVARPKSPLATDPVLAAIRKRGIYRPAADLFPGSATEFIDAARIRMDEGAGFVDENWVNLRPVSLACWLSRDADWRPARGARNSLESG